MGLHRSRDALAGPSAASVPVLSAPLTLTLLGMSRSRGLELPGLPSWSWPASSCSCETAPRPGTSATWRRSGGGLTTAPGAGRRRRTTRLATRTAPPPSDGKPAWRRGQSRSPGWSAAAGRGLLKPSARQGGRDALQFGSRERASHRVPRALLGQDDDSELAVLGAGDPDRGTAGDLGHLQPRRPFPSEVHGASTGSDAGWRTSCHHTTARPLGRLLLAYEPATNPRPLTICARGEGCGPARAGRVGAHVTTTRIRG